MCCMRIMVLPQAEGVCEVGERTDCCACGEEQGFDGHFLEVRERAVAVCALELCGWLVCCRDFRL